MHARVSASSRIFPRSILPSRSTNLGGGAPIIRQAENARGPRCAGIAVGELTGRLPAVSLHATFYVRPLTRSRAAYALHLPLCTLWACVSDRAVWRGTRLTPTDVDSLRPLQ